MEIEVLGRLRLDEVGRAISERVYGEGFSRSLLSRRLLFSSRGSLERALRNERRVLGVIVSEPLLARVSEEYLVERVLEEVGEEPSEVYPGYRLVYLPRERPLPTENEAARIVDALASVRDSIAGIEDAYSEISEFSSHVCDTLGTVLKTIGAKRLVVETERSIIAAHLDRYSVGISASSKKVGVYLEAVPGPWGLLETWINDSLASPGRVLKVDPAELTVLGIDMVERLSEVARALKPFANPLAALGASAIDSDRGVYAAVIADTVFPSARGMYLCCPRATVVLAEYRAKSGKHDVVAIGLRDTVVEKIVKDPILTASKVVKLVASGFMHGVDPEALAKSIEVAASRARRALRAWKLHLDRFITFLTLEAEALPLSS